MSGRLEGMRMGGWIQIVQNEPVAVVGYAQAVRGLAIRGSGEVGADPGGQPGARVGAFRKPNSACRARRPPSTSSGRDQSTKSCPRF